MNDRHGIGLRTAHFSTVLEQGPGCGWVEAITENFIGRGGRPLAVLARARRDVPVALHGVSLSIGSGHPVSTHYLDALAALADQLEVSWVSDHLCFGSVGGHFAHDLWPMPFTEEALTHLVPRIAQVQDHLGRRLALENVSSYVGHRASTASEWQFTVELLRRADCDLLLDLNNLHVNAFNHGYDAAAALDAIPSDRIRCLHLAGHEDHGDYLFDAHGGPVADPVWALYAQCVRRHGPRPTLIEWDQNVPPLERVQAESARAAAIERACLAEAAGAAA